MPPGADKAAPYAPSSEVLALLPEVSGNAVNGLGDATLRPPDPVFWHPYEKIAHHALQKRIEGRYQDHPRLTRFHARYGGRGDGKPGPKAAAPADEPADRLAAELKEIALAGEADLVGIARLDPLWVYSGYQVAAPWIVILGVAMDYDALAQAPAIEAQVEVVRQYNRGTRAARALANWIRARGFEAMPHGGPRAGPVSMIPAALACGFGELGKHGSIINRKLGSRFRLACVLTDMPLVADRADEFGADEFCTRCRLCSNACPPDAIFEAKATVRGVEKWYVDFDKCIPYFDETLGCGICIVVCPWSRPGIAEGVVVKRARRRAAGP